MWPTVLYSLILLPPPPRDSWWIMLLLFFMVIIVAVFVAVVVSLNLPIIQFSSSSRFWCRIFSWFLFVTLNCASVKFSEICNTKNSFFSPKRGPESRRDQWMTLGQELLILRDQLSLSVFFRSLLAQQYLCVFVLADPCLNCMYCLWVH